MAEAVGFIIRPAPIRIERATMNNGPKVPLRPRVALLIESSRAYGRRTLFGVARYVREHQPWSIFLQERSLGEKCPEWLRDWKGDGIIARVESRQTANGIRKLGIPAVDVRYLL